MAPIHDAAFNGDLETLRRLLAEGVSPDGTDFFARTPLHHLCRRSDAYGDLAACFKLLRDAGANLEAVDRDRWIPLHLAAINANVEIMTLLVEAGVNVDAANRWGWTSLHQAASGRDRESTDCVEVLLAAGAGLDARTSAGWRPFDLARRVTHRSRRMWPLFLRAGAEIPTDNTAPYIVRVRNAGGFQRYAQAHVARIASILETPLLPPELVRKVLGFWLHAGYY